MKNSIGPVAAGKKKNPKMEKGLWDNGAKGSEIAGDSNYAKKGKGGTVKKPTVKPNKISSS